MATESTTTSKSTQISDGDFSSAGIMATDGAGTYSLQTVGTDIQAYDANLVSDASYVATDNNYITNDKTKVDKLETVQTLTDGATVAVDMSGSSNFSLATTQNFTLSNPTGLTPGQKGIITITQDATGSRLITLDTNYDTAGGAGITLTTTASAVDVLKYEVISATSVLVELIADIK